MQAETLKCGNAEAGYKFYNYICFRDVFTGLFYTTLLGGVYSNCHGWGSTKETAVTSLKIRINQLNRKTK